MKQVRIGLASCVQTSFWGYSEDLYHKRYVPQMEAVARELDFELVVWQDDIVRFSDAEAACAFMNRERVDFFLLQCTTFPGDGIILAFDKLQARLGLWAVAECSEQGAIPQNSFCGINMLASTLGQYVDAARPVKWFYGEPGDAFFRRRLEVTFRAMRGLKQMEGARVALVGGIAPGFFDFAFDERKTRSRLGVTVDRLPEFGDIKEKALAYGLSEIAPVIDGFAADACCVTDDAYKDRENTARVYKALEDLIMDGGYDGIAVGCWPKYRKDFGIVVCGVIGRLLENGHITACEGDIDSLISMLLLRGIAGDIPMLMDLSVPDFADDTALLWHCGSAPRRFANPDGMKLDGHYKPGTRVTCEDDIKIGTVNDMYYRSGDVTVARFTWEYERMLLLTGMLVDKKNRSFDGSRGWMGDMKIAGKPVGCKELINTLMVSRFQHHYPVVLGNFHDELMECMAWLGVRPIEPVPYQDYLQIF